MTSEIPNPDRERLRQHFLSHDPTAHPNKWDELWKGGFLPWDRNQPNPALVDTLTTRTDVLGPPLHTPTGSSDTPRRKRAFVPGCGRGYDVLLLASFGYDAYGLEVSPNALAACEAYAQEQLSKGAESPYAARDPKVGRGNVKCILGDFFSSEWEASNGIDSGFDLIYDYTFLCALPPPLRPKWAKRISQLLAAQGSLITLEFPTYKHPSTGGPPWGLQPELYEVLLAAPGEEVEYDAEGYVVQNEERLRRGKGLKRVAHWQPERTHEIGKGTDWVGIWKHAEDA